MKQKLSMSTLLIAGALAGGTGQAGASMQSNPDVGMGDIATEQSARSGAGRHRLVQRHSWWSRNFPGPDQKD